SVLLRAARRLREREDIIFVLGGSGDNFEAIRQQARDLPNLRLTGWLNREQIYALLSHSHAGVVSGAPGTEAFPNKSFVYFSMGLPLLSSMEGDLRHFIEQKETGLYFHPDNDADLVNCILKLKDDPALQKKMSDNSRRVFLEKLDADKIYQAYADHVEHMAAKQHTGA
ncbi:MAG TPA: glycosyltransferase, partial [Elusimicrobiales bacterium]|nr:glycosyltransferase [Elusimicrobiales bacterium]